MVMQWRGGEPTQTQRSTSHAEEQTVTIHFWRYWADLPASFQSFELRSGRTAQSTKNVEKDRAMDSSIAGSTTFSSSTSKQENGARIFIELIVGLYVIFIYGNDEARSTICCVATLGMHHQNACSLFRWLDNHRICSEVTAGTSCKFYDVDDISSKLVSFGFFNSRERDSWYNKAFATPISCTA